MTTPSVSIVIPSWNSEAQLRQNLPAVFIAAAKVGAEVIIVDDHSTHDATLTYLKSLGAKITLLSNPKNLGFGATVNRGVTASSRDIVILLNTDVRPDPECFLLARAYFLDQTVFAVGFNSGEGSMCFTWSRGLIHHFRDDSWRDHTPPIAAWASGGQAAFDRRKWQVLGGMDPLYAPFYWEDTDLGYNAWKAGWQIIWGEACHCIHDHKQSVIAHHFGDTTTAVARRNQFLFVWKNIHDWRLLLAHFAWIPYYCLRYPREITAALQRVLLVIAARRRLRRVWKRADRDILKLWN
jgi:GT2 family glycosyltransferase